MSSVSGVGTSNYQASAAVFNINTLDRTSSTTRDDYVAPVETTNKQANKSDVSILKMSDPSIGQNVNITV